MRILDERTFDIVSSLIFSKTIVLLSDQDILAARLSQMIMVSDLSIMNFTRVRIEGGLSR
jgi:hypothetical protein